MQNHLFFALNNNKQLCRQIKTLTYMRSHDSPMSINELVQHVGCSIPTMRQDINNLNDELMGYLKIVSNDKDGYTLSLDTMSMDAILVKMAKESDVFRIIDDIFHHEIHTFDELLADLYLSPTKLRKTLNHINTVLVSYNIALSTRYVDLIGCESDIRYFFFAFYSDFNDFFTIDSNFDRREYIYQVFHERAIQSIIPHFHLSNFRMTLWSIIIHNRIKHQRFVRVDDHLKEELQVFVSFEKFKEAFIDVYRNAFLIHNPPLDDIIWAYAMLLHSVSYSGPSHSIFSHYIKDYTHLETIPLELSQRVESLLMHQFDEPTIHSTAIDPVRSYLINLSILTRISPQLQRVSKSFKLFAHETIDDLVILWMNHLETPEAKGLLPIVFKEDVACSLAMLHFSFISHQKDFDLCVLFAFHGEPGYDDFLMYLSQFMIPKNVTTAFLFDKPITHDILNLVNTDLVVTNYDLPDAHKMQCDVIQLSYIPSMAEWTSLRNAILNLAASKHSRSKPDEDMDSHSFS
ncbi:hypothetical protein AOC36_08010 [Erysipelothrix larvae]|uniref:Mga helix-turn-helix domain-containing protein n=1 Tax=Erysipelothrix larvae TaxID=1514105 RepID=A0A109UHB8_9FIRM|nr:helix-turn-helix domain-containing protein [Erysipelothrix larvae]AMC93931.1 hypothetical protein AOC36_08010 [Erysipelothrix larvae]